MPPPFMEWAVTLLWFRFCNYLGPWLGQHVSMRSPFLHALCRAAHPNGAIQHKPTNQPATHLQSLLIAGPRHSAGLSG